MITINQLLEKTNEMLYNIRPSNKMLEDYLAELLEEYESLVHKLDFDSIKAQIKTSKENVLENISMSKELIAKVLKYYSEAKIAESISELKEYVLNNKLLLTLTIDSATNKEDKNWYRMRNQEKHKRVYSSNEMFHIPFELRGKVNTQRYSLPGYPCLYISRSIWATWEEMHEPKLADFSVARLEPQNSFDVLDLRMINIETVDNYELDKVLSTLPLIISCSIKVLNPDDNFKPEYIIPQLVMLALVADEKRIGCAYTSTQRNPFFNWDMRKLDNIALPVHFVEKEGLCPKLKSYFQITDATNYEYEMLKKAFCTTFWATDDDYGIHDEGEEYGNSIFGQLEERLMDMPLKNL